MNFTIAGDIYSGKAGELSSITIQLRDENFNNINIGGDILQVAFIPIAGRNDCL